MINLTSGNTFPATISSNILAIDYGTNNNRPNMITPTANFTIVITNVPTTSVNAHYRIDYLLLVNFIAML